MKTLFLAWQHTPTAADSRLRAWYPIGRLDREGPNYRFAYTRGVERAGRDAGFHPLAAFPRLDRAYVSETLFPLFQNRVFNSRRDDFADIMARLDLSADDRDPFKILAVSGGERQTDHLEVFPKIETAADGSFACRFFSHGVRHLNPAAQARVESLGDGEALRIAIELDNPVTGTALQLQSEDYHLVGWAPRYLIQDQTAAIHRNPCVGARVIRLNKTPAPLNQRLLVEVRGRLPEGYEPMSGPDFEPVV